MMDVEREVGGGTGSARRRRERRLRSMLRHERMAVAMALAEALHHSSGPKVMERAQYAALRGQKPGTRAKEGEVREEHQALRGQTRLPPGMRPALLVEVQPQGCVERHVVEVPSELAPMVQFLDAPVPQMVDTVLEFFRALHLPVDEQVIAVRKISTDRVSQRLVERCLPQMVEQLVHVPTVLSPLRIAEQIVGIPAPQRGGNWSLQGPLPGQSSTLSPLPKRISERIVEQIAVSSPVERISKRIVEQIAISSPAERISERIVDQIVDISPGDDRGQGSSSSAGLADEDFPGVFRTFPHGKKVRSAGQVSADLPRHVSSWTPAAYEQSKGFHEKEKEKEEAEYERRMQVLNRHVRDDIPLSPTEYAAWRRWSGLPPLPSSSAGKRRKKKKRRKRRLPRSPRPLLLGRARRRQRQWYACNAGFTGYDAPRVLFLFGVARPKMLRIMAGLVQKDSCSGMARLVLVVFLHLALFLLYVASFLETTSGMAFGRISHVARLHGCLRILRNAWFDMDKHTYQASRPHHHHHHHHLLGGCLSSWTLWTYFLPSALG